MNNIYNASKAYQRINEYDIDTNTLHENSNGLDSFASMINNSLQDSIDIQYNAEKMSIKGVSGQADMKDVIMSVQNAESNLSAVLSVRNKIVKAYLDILSMPI